MPFALDGNPSQSEISEAINYLLANFSPNVVVDQTTGQVISPGGFVVSYLYQYIAVKYSDSIDGSTNFSDTPTNREYYGVRNSNDPVESTNPADYVWTKVSGGFGTTKFLYYQTNGGRQIQFQIDTTSPGSTWTIDVGTSIDLDVIIGSSGYMAAFPTIYKWTSTSTAPTRPATTSTYTWSTGAYTAPSGWTTEITTNSTPGSYLWSITVPMIVPSTTTSTVADWTDTLYGIVNISYNGTNGTNGTPGDPGSRSSFIYFYYNTAQSTAPTSPTTGQVSYNFSTNTASISTSGWSTSFSPGSLSTTSANNKYWAISVTFSEATYGGSQNTPVITGPFNWENFNGLVTFTNLSQGRNASGTVTTYIDGGTITTNTLLVDSIKNNTSGTFNSSGTFGLGTGSSIGGYQAAGAFTSSSSSLYALLAANTAGFNTIGAGTTNSGTGAGSAVVGVGAGNSTFTTYKTQGTLGSGRAGGEFTTGGASNIQSAVTADIRLAYYTGGTSYAYYIVSGAAYPFTAGHDALQLLTETVPEIGDLMVDVELIASPTVNDCITKMSVSTSANQKGVVGVFTGVAGTEFVPASLGEYVENTDGTKTLFVMKSEFADIYDTYRPIGINAIGEGKINVCGQNGDIEIGDFICASDMAGKGMKQADDIMRSYTVAKCRQAVTFSSPTEVKQVACIYISG